MGKFKLLYPEFSIIDKFVRCIGSAGVRDIEKREIQAKMVCLMELLHFQKSDGILELLKFFDSKCDYYKFRVYFTEIDVYELLIQILKTFPDDKNITLPALKISTKIIQYNPAILSEDAIRIIIFCLKTQPDAATRKKILKWMKHYCCQHEINRQILFEKGVLDYIEDFITDDTTVSPVIRDACCAVLALAEDDDIPRVNWLAGPRAFMMGNVLLDRLTCLAEKFLNNEKTLYTVLHTIDGLLLKDEIFPLVLDAKRGNGLTIIRNVSLRYSKSKKLCQLCLSLYLKLSKCEIAKRRMLHEGVPFIITEILHDLMKSTFVTCTAFRCIASFISRTRHVACTFESHGIPTAVVEGMKLHPTSYIIQMLGSFIIRLFVFHLPDIKGHLESLGVCEVLLTALYECENRCEYDAKAALKEFGHNVDKIQHIKPAKPEYENPDLEPFKLDVMISEYLRRLVESKDDNKL